MGTSATVNSDEPSEIMTTPEVATFLRVPVGTLRYWRNRAEPEGPPCYSLGRRVVYDRASVLEWRAAQRSASARGDGAA